jgi:hypothetical protein
VLLLALTVVTGMVDAVSYVALGHVFVANMTGNVVFLGFAAASVGGLSVTASLAAIAASRSAPSPAGAPASASAPTEAATCARSQRSGRCWQPSRRSPPRWPASRYRQARALR